MFMDTILQGLTSPLGLMVLLVAAGLTLVLFAVTGSRAGTADPLDKLRRQARDIPQERNSKLSRREESNSLQKRLERYKSFLEPGTDEEKSAAKLEMIQAGYHGRNAVRDFHAAKFIMGLGGLMLGLAFTMLQPADAERSTLMLAMPVLLPTLIGYYLPIYWVNKRREERQEQIARGFPDALDMLLICTEAGQSLDQSINRIARELRAGYPALAEEFETVAHEVKAGKDRLEVLKDMGERCGNVDIRSFVTVLVQSATYGTSVADALRVYAAEMRDKRVMLAEEKANVLPTKLTLGTMLFTVPPLLIILIGPSVHGVMEMLNTTNVSP
ncbi:type II secretion system F family protein [Pararhodobacter sp.]|jgi:tight adherence protein C|uniref:type II secretion system F family protein n=1 Tax=Pararhodobacter sp. TaxID=2127056 RepID=UPI002FDE3390